MRGLLSKMIGAGVERKSETVFGSIEEMWSDYWDGMRRSKSGPSVNINSALSNSTVLACARVRSEAASTVPYKLYQGIETMIGGRARPDRREAREHPLYDLLATAPNEWMTSLEFRETISFHLDLLGNAIVFKNWVSDFRRDEPHIGELILLDPARVSWKQQDDYSMKYTVAGLDGSQAEFTSREIWHIRGPSWNTFEGMKMIKLAREAIGLSLAAEESQSSFHKNGVQPSGILAADGTMTRSQLVRLSAWVRRHFGGSENTGRMLVVDRAAKYIQTRMTGVDAEHLNTRKFQVEQICNGMRVLPIMIGFSGDKNATFASADAMFRAHLVHTARPIYRRLGGSADLFLLSKEERRAGFYTAFTEADFMSPSMEEKSKFYQLGMGGGNQPAWLTQNMVLGYEDLPPVEGGDRLYVPANMGYMDPDGTMHTVTPPKEATTPKPGGE